jgi:hypothetical protein
MNWEVISNERSSLQEYRLFDNNDCKVIIKYNPRHQSARITSGNHHRLFFLESAGSLSGKTIFKNEYGMEIGSLVHDKFHTKDGTLVIDSKKYQYQLQNTAPQELVIFDTHHHAQLASCSIQSTINNSLSNHQQAINNNCYLLGLCWYLFLPVENNISSKYEAVGY